MNMLYVQSPAWEWCGSVVGLVLWSGLVFLVPLCCILGLLSAGSSQCGRVAGAWAEGPSVGRRGAESARPVCGAHWVLGKHWRGRCRWDTWPYREEEPQGPFSRDSGLAVWCPREWGLAVAFVPVSCYCYSSFPVSSSPASSYLLELLIQLFGECLLCAKSLF